jgi:hypothetical protein
LCYTTSQQFFRVEDIPGGQIDGATRPAKQITRLTNWRGTLASLLSDGVKLQQDGRDVV